MNVNTTILLSSQRSGTTFFDAKVNGMCGLPQQGGELIFLDFYSRHNVEHLIKCGEDFDEQCYIKLANSPRLPDYPEPCYYEASVDTLKQVVKSTNYVMFNVMYNAIKEKVSVIENINSPVIHLIRKNLWKRSISDSVVQKTPIAHPKNGDKFELKIKIDKDDVIRRCELLKPNIVKFKNKLQNQKNVKIIYYEDIANKDYWTKEFIDELEDFMKIKFTNRDYYPPLKKTYNFVTITNEEEIMDDELIKKYWIDEV